MFLSRFLIQQKCLNFDANKRPSFQELLKEEFFYHVMLKPRAMLSPYELKDPIKQGAESSLQMYRCNRGARPFAVKVIDYSKADKKHLKAEIDTLVKLRNNPYVISLQDYFQYESKIYLVFDYFSHGNLEAYILERELNKNPLLPVEQNQIAYCVLQAIDDIHKHNIIHRSVHPKNILVDIEEEKLKKVVLTDFGFARVLVTSHAETVFIGVYQSPEMCLPDLGGMHDHKTDIWSFGMLLYFIIFGIHADKYPGNKVMDLLRKGIVKFDQEKAKASPELVEIMLKCLKVNPKERPTAEALLKSPVMTHI
eukprot:TRINITY_DN14639_c0_g1_i2.p1 TRINITY_DN14639_c0_g1~~TRINITY_DN14639_c0_g1_i2.p1  ORF type:complete len:309 (+),score=36.55 TRINITY_DN14639_c0_g1_i2:214-1140(+)